MARLVLKGGDRVLQQRACDESTTKHANSEHAGTSARRQACAAFFSERAFLCAARAAASALSGRAFPRSSEPKQVVTPAQLREAAPPACSAGDIHRPRDGDVGGRHVWHGHATCEAVAAAHVLHHCKDEGSYVMLS